MKAALVAAALAVVAFLGIGVYRAGLDELPPPSNNAQIIFHGGKIFGRRVTTRSWSADYERIVSNSDQTVLNVDGVRHGIIYKAGKPYLAVRADHMTVNTLSHDFTIAGPLEARTVGRLPERRFRTTAAVWSDSAQLLTLSNPVTIVTDGQAPLRFASARFDVRTGDLDVRSIAGPVR